MKDYIANLVESDEPSVRYRARTGITGEDPGSPEIVALRDEIRSSPRVAALLAERDDTGRIPMDPYNKWRGTHWVLYMLAELGYPPGARETMPLRDQVYEWIKPHEVPTPRIVEGRVRHCASFEGNALYYLVTLGMADERAHPLADRLLAWQWPDGGWNCDKKPEACHASFNETLLPLRGLAAYGKWSGRDDVLAAVERTAEVFLSRRLFRRKSNGAVIRADFLKMHWPAYWHYDVLGALRAMLEAGLLCDPRCEEALDLLESKRLPDGGFPSEEAWDQRKPGGPLGCCLIDWGPHGTSRSNPFVSAEALSVLKAAGRL